MPILLAVNVNLTNVAATLSSVECDSAILQAAAANTGIVSLLDTGTAIKLCDLSAGEYINLKGLFTRNLNELDAVSSVALGDKLHIIPFKT